MKRIKLVISYDGTDYVGWQIQKNGLAVEQVINEHLSKLLKEDVIVFGASRTDSGVHAAGNVAVFDTNTRIPAEKISLALNQILPDDIKIVSSEEVDGDFNPRFHAVSKTYRYTVLNSRYYDPLYRLYAAYVYYPLDIEKMKEASEYLLGEHDFKAFSSARGQQKTSIRTINSITIDTKSLRGNKKKGGSGEDNMPQLVNITVNGNGFLYNMVRIIAATLLKVGMGIYPPEYVKEILESCDRRLSAPKAAACGLTLIEIKY